jgi:hypothetical protein
MATNDKSRELLTPKQLAKEMGVSESWIRDHVIGRRKPTLPHIWIGDKRGLLRFDRDEIDAFYRNNTRNSAE